MAGAALRAVHITFQIVVLAQPIPPSVALHALQLREYILHARMEGLCSLQARVFVLVTRWALGDVVVNDRSMSTPEESLGDLNWRRLR